MTATPIGNINAIAIIILKSELNIEGGSKKNRLKLMMIPAVYRITSTFMIIFHSVFSNLNFNNIPNNNKDNATFARAIMSIKSVKKSGISIPEKLRIKATT